MNNTIEPAHILAKRKEVNEAYKLSGGNVNDPRYVKSFEELHVMNQALMADQFRNERGLPKEAKTPYDPDPNRVQATPMHDAVSMRIQSESHLQSYPQNIKVADLYDDDPEFRAAVVNLVPDFEYPNVSYLTISELITKYSMKPKNDLRPSDQPAPARSRMRP